MYIHVIKILNFHEEYLFDEISLHTISMISHRRRIIINEYRAHIGRLERCTICSVNVL